MKKAIIFAALAATAAVSSPAFAAPSSATASGSATATVITPITLTHDAAGVLNFGSFTSDVTAGSVTVDRNTNAGAATGGVTLVGGTPTTADSFTVGGDATRAFTISTTGGSVSNGATTMAFTTAANANGTLNASGAATFKVGGTLTVPASAAQGTYTGTYGATVTYN